MQLEVADFLACVAQLAFEALVLVLEVGLLRAHFSTDNQGNIHAPQLTLLSFVGERTGDFDSRTGVETGDGEGAQFFAGGGAEMTGSTIVGGGLVAALGPELKLLVG